MAVLIQVILLLVMITPAPVKEAQVSFYPARDHGTPKYFKKGLRLQMGAQMGNTCLPALMSYMNQEVCGGKLSKEYYITWYEDRHPGFDVLEDGIVGTRQDVVNYIGSHFNWLPERPKEDPVACINAGQPVITTITYKDQNHQLKIHCVLIIGYDSSMLQNPKLYYMDPLYGHVYNDLDVVTFKEGSPVYALRITGCN